MASHHQDKTLDVVNRFFTGTGASYDRIVKLCTFGADGLWKKRILNRVPRSSTDILDLACGTGILTFKLASAFPSARILGVDITPEYLEIARAKATEWRVGNTRFVLSSAEETLSDQGFDCIVSSYLAKYAELKILTVHSGEMLRKGGTLIMHDFTYPRNRAFVELWKLYFRILQTAGARMYPEWRSAFEGLPDLIRETCWVQELKALLFEQGFSKMVEERLTFGTAAIVTAVKT